MGKPILRPDTGPGANPGDMVVELPATGITVVRADKIDPEPITWLWPGWLARGKLHLIAGPPGTGKTTVALAIASTLSVAGRWPDGTPADQHSTLIWSGEDDPRDTLVPRLVACGANRAHIGFVASVTDEDGPRAFDPAIDVPMLADRIATMEPRPELLIIDPLVSAVAGDSHKNAEVRRALQPLVDLAQIHECAVLGIAHFSKGTAGRDPVERLNGSIAFGALVRIALVAAKMPDTEGGGRVLALAKNNIGPDGGGFRYDIEPLELEGYPEVFTTRILWGEPIAGTAREILRRAEAPQEDPDDTDAGSALSEAEAFLRELLKDGAMKQQDIQVVAKDNGHAWATVRRAKAALGVKSTKHGVGKGSCWTWELPEGAQRCSSSELPEGAQRCSSSPVSLGMGTFEDGEHLWGNQPKGAHETQRCSPPGRREGVNTFDEGASTSDDTREGDAWEGEL